MPNSTSIAVPSPAARERLLPDAARTSRADAVEQVVTPEYRHVPFQVIGSTPARLGKLQPLPARRFVLEDDEA